MWPSHQVLPQLHYLSDHRLGLPRTKPTRTCPPRPEPGQPRRLSGSSDPGSKRHSCLGLGLPGLRPQKGQGPSRLHGASSYLQTETGRSEVAAAKVAPGPQPPLPPHPRPPHPPSPHGFLFPSPHSSPTSHCSASSLWTACQRFTVTPAPQLLAWGGLPLFLTPRAPSVWAPWSSPLPPGPSPLWPAQGIFPQFSVPLRAWKSSNTNGQHDAARLLA